MAEAAEKEVVEQAEVPEEGKMVGNAATAGSVVVGKADYRERERLAVASQGDIWAAELAVARLVEVGRLAVVPLGAVAVPMGAEPVGATRAVAREVAGATEAVQAA